MAKRYEELADALDEMSDHLRVTGQGSLARDYQIAASTLRTAEDIPPDPAQMDGVSVNTRDSIAEWRSRGEIEKLNQFKQKRPYIESLTRIASVGPKTAQTINQETGASSIEDVRQLRDNDELEDISGVGPKTATTIKRSIAQLET